ncbi:MAG: hypothetical protein IPO92_11485 [Saprospiraceae bacterium]|nr:hypothetical protein [Saprospiraceae bacterium]
MVPRSMFGEVSIYRSRNGTYKWNTTATTASITVSSRPYTVTVADASG